RRMRRGCVGWSHTRVSWPGRNHCAATFGDGEGTRRWSMAPRRRAGVTSVEGDGGSLMSAEENKAIVRRYLEEGFHRRNPAAVDELVAPDFVHHDPVNPLHGPAGLKEYQAVLFAAFPDLRLTLEDIVAEGDKVVVRYTMTGTHRGAVAGIAPTGK